MQVTSLRRLLDDDIMEHLEHITELSDRYAFCSARPGRRLQP
jgi:hypothetical protein